MKRSDIMVYFSNPPTEIKTFTDRFFIEELKKVLKKGTAYVKFETDQNVKPLLEVFQTPFRTMTEEVKPLITEKNLLEL